MLGHYPVSASYVANLFCTRSVDIDSPCWLLDEALALMTIMESGSSRRMVYATFGQVNAMSGGIICC